MAEKILAKDSKIGSIYLTKGGRQIDSQNKETFWGFYSVRIIKKINNEEGEIKRVVVFTPWQTELNLPPDYSLEVTDLKVLSTDFNPILTGATKISTDDEAPPEYIKKLKSLEKKEQVSEISYKNKDKKEALLEELKKGSSINEIAKILNKTSSNIYVSINNLKKKGYKIKKVEKGVFKLVE